MKEICSVQGCDKFRHKGIYCNTHSYRFDRYGDPLKGQRFRPKEYKCSIEGCTRKYDSRGYCKLHYGQKIYTTEQTRKRRREQNKTRKEKLFVVLNQFNCQCISKDCFHEGKCCVSDIRCLQFEHKNNDGYKDKSRFKKNGGISYIYYRNHPEEAREKLQVYCANCNWIKRERDEELIKIKKDKNSLNMRE